MPGYTMPGTRPRPCFSSLAIGSVSACGSPSGTARDCCLHFRAAAPPSLGGLRRSTHLAVLRIEKSLGSDNLMTRFQAEPTWRGSDPDVYDRPYLLQISWTLGAISAYRLLGRSGKRWCSI